MCRRSRSPLAMWVMPNCLAIRSAWVPLPDPGAPIMRIRFARGVADCIVMCTPLRMPAPPRSADGPASHLHVSKRLWGRCDFVHVALGAGWAPRGPPRRLLTGAEQVDDEDQR